MAPLDASPPALLEANRKSTTAWQDDLKSLFDRAKDRFPDVVWELVGEDDDPQGAPEEVWGHKAVVYARAPPSFQARYFSFKPPPPTSPLPYSASPNGYPAQSALSLSLGVDFTSISRSPSPFRASSPAPSTNNGALLRLPIAINPTLFSQELEYLYTGKGFGEAFEFLFDTTESREEGHAEEARIDKLRKDLVFMWRSRLYSDIRITLTGTFSSTNHETATAVFSSHRFILVSRCPYFQTQLVSWGTPRKDGELLTVTLPSPPFTPASLHFTLGFIYTGTLAFSNRTFDLDTAFHILRSAAYLSLDTLYDEVQARIVQEMMHGLFHAFLEFSEYESATGGKWGTGGCRCRQCARRAPRVLEFALLEDVKNPHLERGARRALVGLFGEGWCTTEFANLPQKIRDSLVKGLGKRTTPMNIFPLLYAAHSALNRLKGVIDSWADVVKEMVLAARKTIDDVLCTQATECFEQPEWLEIMESNGARFEDGEKVELIMDAVRRGMNEKNAATLYQTLVSSILLRPHPTDPEDALLPATSHIRVSVEQTRMDILRWLRRRWLNVKQEGGFDGLEGWAVKEISHEIEVGVDDLLGPVTPSATARGGSGRMSRRPSIGKGDDSETMSVHSMRTGISRHTMKNGVEMIKPSSTSVRSVARSTHSTVSKTSTTATSRRPTVPRPDSKLTPGHSTGASSVRSSITESRALSSPPPPFKEITSITTPVRRSVANTTSLSERASKVRSSAASVKSQASTIRRTTAGPSSLRPPSSLSRPSSTLSHTTSEGSTAFETAKSDLPSSAGGRSRRGSTASSISTVSVRTTATSTPRLPRSRPPSSATKSTPPAKSKRPPPSPVDHIRPSPITKRTTSSASVRSTISTISTASASPSVVRRVVTRKPSNAPSVQSVISTRTKTTEAGEPPTVKGKSREVAHEKQDSIVSSGSASTIKESLKRKSSSDTIRESSLPKAAVGIPRGATLDVGIPCIISSKKARFRAFARYIGEVEGESGPWVGVEVPVNENWPDERLDGRQWNDGSWGGIRYFEIGSQSEWDYDDDRAVRRRRVDWVSNLGKDPKNTLKREGDQLSIERAKRLRSVSPAVSDISNSESRGLFVRPQQVLYVVDAVGTDL